MITGTKQELEKILRNPNLFSDPERCDDWLGRIVDLSYEADTHFLDHSERGQIISLGGDLARNLMKYMSEEELRQVLSERLTMLGKEGQKLLYKIVNEGVLDGNPHRIGRRSHVARHGKTLQQAYNSKGELISLDTALTKTNEPFFCPISGCADPAVSPVEGTPLTGQNSHRDGYFRHIPNGKIQKRAPKEVLRKTDKERTVDSLVTTLATVDSLDFVYTGSKMKVQLYEEGMWRAPKNRPGEFDIDIVFQRSTHHNITSILHVLELPLKDESTHSLYQMFREIARERSPKKYRRFIVTADGKKISLPKKVYQNFIFIANEYAYRPKGNDRITLVPTQYNYIMKLTPDLMFFDPTEFELFKVDTSSPQKEEKGIPYDSRRVFEAKKQKIPYFLLLPAEMGRIQVVNQKLTAIERFRLSEDEMLGGKELIRYSLNIPNMKIAKPLEVLTDDLGRPTGYIDVHNHFNMFFPFQLNN